MRHLFHGFLVMYMKHKTPSDPCVFVWNCRVTDEVLKVLQLISNKVLAQFLSLPLWSGCDLVSKKQLFFSDATSKESLSFLRTPKLQNCNASTEQSSVQHWKVLTWSKTLSATQLGTVFRMLYHVSLRSMWIRSV